MTNPRPRGNAARTTWRRNAWGFSEGCAMPRSIPRRGLRGDDVAERALCAGTPKSARAPAPQVVLHPALERMPQDHPGLEHRSRHDAHVMKFRANFGRSPPRRVITRRAR